MVACKYISQAFSQMILLLTYTYQYGGPQLVKMKRLQDYRMLSCPCMGNLYHRSLLLSKAQGSLHKKEQKDCKSLCW